MGVNTINRLWLISDIHFGVRIDSHEWILNHVDYFNNFFIPLLIEHKKDGDALMIMGDIFENQKSIDILVGNVATDIITKLSSIMPVHIICGNHDKYKKNDNGVNSLKNISLIPNVHVYVDNFHMTTEKGKELLLCPFSNVNADIEDYIKEKSNNISVDYVFSHVDISGLKYQNGMSIKKGLTLTSPSFKKFYSGHIHIIEGNDKYQYVGSPFHTSRSDIGQKKGIFLLDLDTDKEFFFENNHSPKFIKIEITEDILNGSIGDLKPLVHNNYVEVFIAPEYVDRFDSVLFQKLMNKSGFKYRNIEFKRARKSNVCMVSGDDGTSMKLDMNTSLLDTITQIISSTYKDDPALSALLIGETKKLYNQHAIS